MIALNGILQSKFTAFNLPKPRANWNKFNEKHVTLSRMSVRNNKVKAAKLIYTNQKFDISTLLISQSDHKHSTKKSFFPSSPPPDNTHGWWSPLDWRRNGSGTASPRSAFARHVTSLMKPPQRSPTQLQMKGDVEYFMFVCVGATPHITSSPTMGWSDTALSSRRVFPRHQSMREGGRRRLRWQPQVLGLLMASAGLCARRMPVLWNRQVFMMGVAFFNGDMDNWLGGDKWRGSNNLIFHFWCRRRSNCRPCLIVNPPHHCSHGSNYRMLTHQS